MALSKAHEIVDSALEFIRNSCDYYDNDSIPVQRRLKHSTIELITGIELLLKARLCQEHWTLILSDPDRYREGDWESGQFVSVGIDEALGRLKRILKAGLPTEIQAAVMDLARLRNQYVHFVCRATLESVTATQLKAWHHVLDLLNGRFLRLTYKQTEEVEYARKKMLTHEEFIETRYREATEQIQFAKDSGFAVIHCPFCGKESLRVGDDTKCLVCGGDSTHAEAYAEAFVANSHEYDDPKDYWGAQEVAFCSDCGEKACIRAPDELEPAAMEDIQKRLKIPYEPGMDLEAYVCLSCGGSFDAADINECTSCGTPFFSNDETGVCPDCEDRWKEE